MRFMVLVKADKNTEAAILPDEKLIVEMGKINEELVKAGVLLAADGLHVSSKGVRIKFSAGGKRTVTDGPFTESKELVGGSRGPYSLQAAIAACHARARMPAETDWARIAALYEELAQLAPSPVVALNRAVAVAMAFGPQAGLELADGLTSEPSLQGYHLVPSVRGDFLAKLGRVDKACAEFKRAASLTRNARERELLLERARACAGGSTEARP